LGKLILNMAKKKIVYLFGAGATHAVVKALNPDLGLLTVNVQEQIETNYSKRGIDSTIWNELVTQGNDVEHLISVLESQHNYAASEKLRKYYRNAIVTLSEKIPTNPLPANLYSILIDLYEVNGLDEELLSCITLNYEDILERSIKVHFGYDVDYVVKTGNKEAHRTPIKVYKLHGSFNWLNSRPITIKKMTTIESKDTLWIPPGVEKRKENYPFNLLWGKVIEDLLNCDILRIVGCSLSRNDWGLIPVLYTVQRFNQNGKNVEIEIIDYPETAKTIKHTYKYLQTKGLIDLPDILSFYKKQFPETSPEPEIVNEIENKFLDKDKINPFQEWLDAKADFLISQGIDIQTKRNFLYNLYYKAT
jgi:hypothetical protein